MNTAVNHFPQPDPGRELPHNFEAEQALLGAILLNNLAYSRVSEFLACEHFANELHAEIYRVCAMRIEDGKVANPLTLKPYFDNVVADRGQMAERGEVTMYLARLAGSATTIINAADYGRVILDLWKRRRAIQMGEALINNAHVTDPKVSADDILEAHDQDLTKLLSSGQVGEGPKPIGDVLQAALEKVDEARRGGQSITGVTTGLTELDNLLGGLQPTDLILLAARPSMGKAQPLHARIKTVAGWKTMHDIAVGDALASPDGEVSFVIGKHPQGLKQIYRVTFHDGRSAECCDDHLWLVYCKYFPEKHRVLPLREIRRLLQRKHYAGRICVEPVSGEFGNNAPLPVPAYVLGVLIGDGSLTAGNFSITSADAELVTRCGALLQDGYHLRHLPPYRYDLVKRRRGGPSYYRDALAALGLYGKGSNAKFIPPAYLAASYEDRLELIRGLLDTDGTVERDGTIRFCTVSRQLAEDMRQLAWSLGGIVRTSTKVPNYTHNGERRKGQLSYVISIRHNNLPMLLTLPRKLAKLSKNPNLRRVRIRLTAVEPVNVAEACCITVSHPDGLYITDNYIPTHNSTLAFGIGIAAARAGVGTAVFSLEMGGTQVGITMMASEAGVSSQDQKRGRVDDQQFERLAHSTKAMKTLPMWLDDTPSLTIAALRARARSLKRRGVGLIVVDYLQLIRTGDRGMKRYEEVTEISRSLKAIAKELRVPLVALSQLSREVESRTDRRPILADLRESGALEQDADVVMFLYRDEYYLKREKPAAHAKAERKLEWDEMMQACQGQAEIIVAKQRTGPIGTVKVSYDETVSRFRDLAEQTSVQESFEL